MSDDKRDATEKFVLEIFEDGQWSGRGTKILSVNRVRIAPIDGKVYDPVALVYSFDLGSAEAKKLADVVNAWLQRKEADDER